MNAITAYIPVPVSGEGANGTSTRRTFKTYSLPLESLPITTAAATKIASTILYIPSIASADSGIFVTVRLIKAIPNKIGIVNSITNRHTSVGFQCFTGLHIASQV